MGALSFGALTFHAPCISPEVHCQPTLHVLCLLSRFLRLLSKSEASGVQTDGEGAYDGKVCTLRGLSPHPQSLPQVSFAISHLRGLIPPHRLHLFHQQNRYRQKLLGYLSSDLLHSSSSMRSSSQNVLQPTPG